MRRRSRTVAHESGKPWLRNVILLLMKLAGGEALRA